ncbi:MAG TPA: hydroxyphenylacetyl-CoA thioesterase PaaI [Caulobacteraceae bacterium]|jgi:acyl-CoA thioesterase
MTTDADRRARAIADHMLSQEGTGPAWGIEIEEVREGYARIAMIVRADMLNGHRIAHGAMTFAIADTAFAYACNSRNVATVAQQASIVFLSAAHEGERLVAEAKEAVVQGRTGVYEITVTVGDRTVAVFQGLSRTLGGPVFEELS